MPSTKKIMKPKPRRNTNSFLSTTPFSPGNPAIRLKLEVYVGAYATTAATGAIAVNVPITAGLINSFASRFVLFDEYVIESVTMKLNCCSSSNPGIINAWYEPVAGNTGTPTSTDAKDNKTLTFSAGDNNKTHVIGFNPKNSNTQIWSPITTTSQSCGNFKIYTDHNNFSSSTAATDYLVVSGVMTVLFRGFA
jgi:hypothetical protein